MRIHRRFVKFYMRVHMVLLWTRLYIWKPRVLYWTWQYQSTMLTGQAEQNTIIKYVYKHKLCALYCLKRSKHTLHLTPYASQFNILHRSDWLCKATQVNHFLCKHTLLGFTSKHVFTYPSGTCLFVVPVLSSIFTTADEGVSIEATLRYCKLESDTVKFSEGSRDRSSTIATSTQSVTSLTLPAGNASCADNMAV